MRIRKMTTNPFSLQTDEARPIEKACVSLKWEADAAMTVSLVVSQNWGIGRENRPIQWRRPPLPLYSYVCVDGIGTQEESERL